MLVAAFGKGAGAAALSVIANSGTASGNATSGSNATGTLSFNSDGSITKGATGTNNGSGSSAWLSAVSAGNGTGFWMRATVASGALTTGTTGTWQAMSGSPSYSVGPATTSAASCVLTIEFATDSGGSNIVSTNSWAVGYSHTAGAIGSPSLSAHSFGGDTSSTVTFGNNGVLDIVDGSARHASISSEWMSGTGATSTDCANYELVLTYVSGPNTHSGSTGNGGADKSGSAYATALNLATSRTITIAAFAGTLSGTGSGTLVFDAAIRPAGGGTNLASARFTISASV